MTKSYYLSHLRDLSQVQDRSVAETFYTEVYRGAFGDPDLEEDPNIWGALLPERPQARGLRLDIILARGTHDNTCIGGALVNYYPRSNVSLLSYLVVRREHRHSGVAGSLVREVIETVGRASEGGLLFAEVSKSDSSDANSRAVRHLAAEFDFAALGFDYVQPALGLNKREVDSLELLVRTQSIIKNHEIIDRLVAFLIEYYSALGLASSKSLKRMIDRLRSAPAVTVATLQREDLTHRR